MTRCTRSQSVRSLHLQPDIGLLRLHPCTSGGFTDRPHGLASETLGLLINKLVRVQRSAVVSCADWLLCAVVRMKQRAVVGLEMYYGDNRDDTHMFQLIKAHDVAQHIKRRQVSVSLYVCLSVCMSLCLSVC